MVRDDGGDEPRVVITPDQKLHFKFYTNGVDKFDGGDITDGDLRQVTHLDNGRDVGDVGEGLAVDVDSGADFKKCISPHKVVGVVEGLVIINGEGRFTEDFDIR